MAVAVLLPVENFSALIDYYLIFIAVALVATTSFYLRTIRLKHTMSWFTSIAIISLIVVMGIKMSAFFGIGSAQSQLYVPEVLACDQFEGQAFLALEFIEEGPKPESFASNFGRGLAALHQKEADAFGWPKSNYIGSLLLRNDSGSSWTDFYFNCRLEPLFAKAFDSAYVNRKDKKALTGRVHHLDALLPQESPALIHGDLWAGNHLCTKEGKGVLIDPAVYYGHREMDLAMMLLFGGYGQETFSSYQEEHPLEPGFKERVPIHQLYPLLVHLNLFGSSYLGSCREVWTPFL